MGQKFRYDHDVETVFALLTSEDYLVERSEALGERNVSVTATTSGSRTTLKMRRDVERDLPKVLAKMFNAVSTLDVTETWDNSGEGAEKSGTFTMDIQGQPVTINGRFTLRPAGDGSEHEIDVSCKAKIPLIGKKVEKFVNEQVSSDLPKEINYNKKALAG